MPRAKEGTGTLKNTPAGTPPPRGNPLDPRDLSVRALSTPEPLARAFARRVQQEGARDLTQGDYKNVDFANVSRRPRSASTFAGRSREFEKRTRTFFVSAAGADRTCKAPSMARTRPVRAAALSSPRHHAATRPP